MKLLIITQKVDKKDPILGFMHRWIEEFSKQCEQIIVICLYEGEHNLPLNVKVLSLGKEKKISRIRYLLRFFRYVFRERKSYDSVWVHMNQIYVLLGGIFWKILGKKIGLWYAHGKVSLTLRLAEKMSDYIFTSTLQGFRIHSKKLHCLGQGIDAEYVGSYRRIIEDKGTYRFVTVGRISPVKDYETAIEGVIQFKETGSKVEYVIIGDVGKPEDKKYLHSLETLILERKLDDKIQFLGPVQRENLLPYFESADAFLNTSETGSLDKAGLDAMVSGLPVFTSNEAYLPVLGHLSPYFLFPKKDSRALSTLLGRYFSLPREERQNISEILRKEILSNHSLPSFVKKVIEVYHRNE